MSIEEMKQKVLSMPTGQWFGPEDITGGPHNPDLWQHLCHLDSNHYRRENGDKIDSDQTYTSFIWRAQGES